MRIKHHTSADREAGFTLAEALAGMLFLAIVIPVTLNGLLTANRAGVVAERRRVASQLADRKLTELVLTATWRDEATEGDFGEGCPGYRWELTEAVWEEDTMRLIGIEVFFYVQGREYSVWLATVVEEAEAL